MIKKIFVSVVSVINNLLFLAFSLTFIWFCWWIFLSPRDEFWFLLDHINPLYHPPREIIKTIFQGSEFEGHRFVILIGVISTIIREILQVVVLEKETMASKKIK